jgi:hypothetical protein
MSTIDYYEPSYSIPEWRKVRFPNGRLQIYKDLKHAINGRIIACAWANYKESTGKSYVGWSEFARHIGLLRKSPVNKRSMNGGVSSVLYGHVWRGTLPKDETIRQKLIALSGYPWE